jgi:hypothetical protein
MWILFDISVNIIAVITTWILPLTGNAADDTFRMFRLLRLLRTAQVTKVFPALKIIVEGLLLSTKSMLWILILSCVVLYVCAIICVEVLGREDAGYPAYDHNAAHIRKTVAGEFNNFIYFGTVPRAFVTLCGLYCFQSGRLSDKSQKLMLELFLCFSWPWSL